MATDQYLFKNGEYIKPIQGVVNLYESKGQLVEEDGEFSITLDGINHLNRVTNINLVPPSFLTLPSGKRVGNPYIETDSVSDSINKVWAKKYAIGYSPTGNLVITGALVIFDAKMYFLHNCIEVINKNKDAGRLCCKSNISDEEKNGNYSFFFLAEDLGVLINNSNIEIINCIQQFSKHKKYAQRIAEGMAERNALRKHPSLSVPLQIEGTEGNHVAKVTLVGYTNNLTQLELLNAIKQIESSKDDRVIIADDITNKTYSKCLEKDNEKVTKKTNAPTIEMEVVK